MLPDSGNGTENQSAGSSDTSTLLQPKQTDRRSADILERPAGSVTFLSAERTDPLEATF
jgi:hypothetical protein